MLNHYFILSAVQLLQKLSITALGKREKLLRVIKNPVTQYLPVNARKIGDCSLNKALAYFQFYSAELKCFLGYQVSHIVQKSQFQYRTMWLLLVMMWTLFLWYAIKYKVLII